MITIGNRIKAIRYEKGMTQNEFGKLFDAPVPAVSHWETDKNKPNPTRLKAIAKLGNMPVEELMYGKPIDDTTLDGARLIKINRDEADKLFPESRRKNLHTMDDGYMLYTQKFWVEGVPEIVWEVVEKERG